MIIKHILLSAVLALAAILQVHTTIAPTVTSTNTCPSTNCCDNGTITVFGSASVQAPADQALLYASLSVNANTSQLAVTALANLVNQLITILKANNLTTTNLVSTSFNVYPNSSYNNGVTKVLGQIATESFTITIPILNGNGSRISKLIDSLIKIKFINLNGLSFALFNQTNANTQARKLAFQSAKTKAQDYASALQRKVGKLLNVVDFQGAPTVINSQLPGPSAVAKDPSTSTTVNVGTIAVSYSLSVVYVLG